MGKADVLHKPQVSVRAKLRRQEYQQAVNIESHRTRPSVNALSIGRKSRVWAVDEWRPTGSDHHLGGLRAQDVMQIQDEICRSGIALVDGRREQQRRGGQ
ncbi:unnamed protein product, partial [Polarella glacialis]